MRLLEFVLILWSGISLAFAPRTSRRIGWLITGVALSILVLQLLFESFRWQMLGAYGSVVFLVCSVARATAVESDSKRASKQFRSLGIFSAGASALACLLAPIPTLPAPNGPYGVGTVFYKLEDSRRQEIFAEDSQPRRIMMQVWYPIKKGTAGAIAPFMQSYSSLSPFLDAPLFAILASHIPLIKTHSIISAKIAAPEGSTRFPLLIFSHGLFGGKIQNTLLMEHLASQGFVVAAIDHTYDCAFAIFPDRTICSRLIAPHAGLPSVTSAAAMETRVLDASFTLDELTRLNANDPQGVLTGKLDLTAVGILGHSLGGQTTMLACARDKRFKAGLALDGASTAFDTTAQPIMLIQADRDYDALNVEELTKHLTGPEYVLVLKNSGHANFTDLPMLTPARFFKAFLGRIDATKANEQINGYASNFFKNALNAKVTPPPKESEYIRVQVWRIR